MLKEAALLYGTGEGDSSGSLRSFRDLPVNLHRTREALVHAFRSTLQRYGLTDPQWRVLRILSTADRMESADLAARSMLLGPSVSRILRDLRKRKLVVTIANRSDARRPYHSITPAARALIERIVPEFGPVYERLARHVSSREIATLNALLERVRAALRHSVVPDSPRKRK